ncbi:MAG: hypothetical protein IIB45_09430 [Candidatus Marinimicrobia bacterium]|nr:hypothetical protein [Candidatus Neomarinimicrobiota bacterium]
MYKLTLILLSFSFLMGQAQDTLVKYFPTDIQRSEILDKESSEKDVKGKAHFKSTYTPQGKLINVEYFPAKKTKQSTLSGLKLYYGYWNPDKRDLADGLTRDQLDGREYYEVRFNRKGRIKTVTLFNQQKRKLWSYHFIWNKSGTRSKYEVEFHIRKSLMRYDEFLFANDLSELRPGWRAEIKEREDGRPHTVIIKDELGLVYYFYQFQYIDGEKKSRTKEIIVSEYFRDDSSKVGMHTLYYNKREYLFLTEYYNRVDSLLYSNSYDYSNAPKEILLTVKDGKGKMLEKRIIPFSKKYKRQLGPPKNKTGLADILEFIENTGEENLLQFARLIEETFNITVDTEVAVSSADEVDIAVVSKEKINEKIKIEKAKERTSDKQKQKFAIGLNIGNKLVSGKYLGDNNIFEMGLDITFPLSFNLLWFSITPSLSYGRISFHGNDQSSVSWVTLESPDFIPLKFPLIIHGAVGTVGPGFGIKGGVKTKFYFGVDITLGTSIVIANDIDGKRQPTGYLSADLGVNYTLPF